MKLTTFTISQTKQLKQFEPLNVQATFEIDSDTENVSEAMLHATRFIANTVKAEIIRTELILNGLTEPEKAKRQAFLDKHLAEKYFGD